MSKKNAHWSGLARGYSRQFGKAPQRGRWWKRMEHRVRRHVRVRSRQWRGWHGRVWDIGNFGENPF